MKLSKTLGQHEINIMTYLFFDDVIIFYDVIKQEQSQGIIAILVCLASVAISFDEIKLLNQFFNFCELLYWSL